MCVLCTWRTDVFCTCRCCTRVGRVHTRHVCAESISYQGFFPRPRSLRRLIRAGKTVPTCPWTPSRLRADTVTLSLCPKKRNLLCPRCWKPPSGPALGQGKHSRVLGSMNVQEACEATGVTRPFWVQDAWRPWREQQLPTDRRDDRNAGSQIRAWGSSVWEKSVAGQQRPRAHAHRASGGAGARRGPPRSSWGSRHGAEPTTVPA